LAGVDRDEPIPRRHAGNSDLSIRSRKAGQEWIFGLHTSTDKSLEADRPSAG
jgi:hypothetical protein